MWALRFFPSEDKVGSIVTVNKFRDWHDQQRARVVYVGKRFVEVEFLSGKKEMYYPEDLIVCQSKEDLLAQFRVWKEELRRVR